MRFKQFMAEITQEAGKSSPRKIGASVSVGILIVGALAMISIFVFHALGGSADYIGLGTGVGALAGGSGAGAFLHSKSSGESP